MEKRKENILGTKPVAPLLISMAVPIMFSMLVQALYNIVDSIFVAKIGENALTSVSLAFPVQNLMISVGVGTAVGLNALLSRRLGEKNYDSANRVAENGVFLALCSWAVFAICGALFSGAFMNAFTKDAQINSMGVTYLQIVTIGSLGIFMSITYERILQVTGKTIYQMISQLTGAVINIVLDPVLIFGLLGLPAMGVAGAAYATIIGQWCGMLVGMVLNRWKNHEVHLSVRHFRPSWRAIRGIYAVGLPSIVMQSIGSVMVVGVNMILIAFTQTAVSVFGIYFKLQSFVFMPVFGATSAMVPIIGYNYGARRPVRIRQCLRTAMVLCLSIMAAGTLLFELAPRALLAMFDASEAMLSIGIPALRIIAICFCFAGFAITASSLFQALGEGMLSLVISVVRQLVVLLPAAFVLAKVGGLEAVWWSFPIAEAFSMLLTAFFLRRTLRHKVDILGQRTQNAAQ